MAIDNINTTDNLNTGRVKLNEAIDQANLSEIDSATAIATADTAVVIANTADAKSTTTQDQLDAIVIASGTSDAETIQARGDEPLLYNRLDKVDTQLAETTQEFRSLENANAQDELVITNYLGNSQNIHPKVLYFPIAWNGFKYWMAYTPYPFGDTTAENPCIAVSNDKFNWTVPNGLVNPLEPAPAEGYNSDTHLVYREDINVLEIWWRKTDGSTSTISRRTTIDGVNWTVKEDLLILSAPLSQNDMLSPSVIFEDGKYKVWSILSSTATIKRVRYTETTDGITWTTPVFLSINWGDAIPWHLDVIRTDLGYEMIVTAFKEGGNNNSADLYYLIQNLDGTFTTPKIIIARSKNITSIDYRGIYRSSILKIDGKYNVFYSAIDVLNARHMSISYGDNIFGLNGYINYDQIKKHNGRIKEITPLSTITDLDVSNLDVLSFPSGSASTLNSLKGGYLGKKITLLMTTGNPISGCNIINSSRIATPSLLNYNFTQTQMVAYLICDNVSGENWRLSAPTIQLPYISTYIRLTDATSNYVDYDVSNLDTIAFQSSTPIIIDSFTGGYVGKKIDVIVIGSSTSVTFKNSARIVTPSATDYNLLVAQTGVRLICTGTDVYRLII